MDLVNVDVNVVITLVVHLVNVDIDHVIGRTLNSRVGLGHP